MLIKEMTKGGFVIISLCFVAGICSIWLPFWSSLRAVFGLFFVLFLPGYIWGKVFWGKDTGFIERGVVSVGLSLAFVPLIVFTATKMGIFPSVAHIVFEIVFICLAGFACYVLNDRLNITHGAKT